MSSVRRVLLVTHDDPLITRAVLPTLAEAIAGRGVELVLGEDEVAKHPDLRPVSVDRPDEVDLVLVLGGDGTMLRALHRVIGRAIPCVGVNYGTFGFLTTLRANEIPDNLDVILGGGLEVVELPTVEVETPEGRFVAINDVLVTADMLGRMAVLEWAVNGVQLGKLGCDGVLVSTPAINHLIRDGRTFQIPGTMQTGKAVGMQLLNEELAQLVRNKKVEAEEALARSVDKDDLAKRIGRPVQHSGAHSV